MKPTGETMEEGSVKDIQSETESGDSNAHIDEFVATLTPEELTYLKECIAAKDKEANAMTKGDPMLDSKDFQD